SNAEVLRAACRRKAVGTPKAVSRTSRQRYFDSTDRQWKDRVSDALGFPPGILAGRAPCTVLLATLPSEPQRDAGSARRQAGRLRCDAATLTRDPSSLSPVAR